MCINPYITVNLKDVIFFHQKMSTSTINLQKWTQFFIKTEKNRNFRPYNDPVFLAMGRPEECQINVNLYHC